MAKCQATAKAVAYPVPCPLRVPTGLTGLVDAGGTPNLNVIGPAGLNGSSASWRGWVVGSSWTAGQHLVITASPTRLTSYAKLVNGPAWFPRERVRLLGWVSVGGRRMRSIYVPAATNDGSAFMHHVVLVWSERGHTYGFGFHDVDGIRRALRRDEALARGIRLVGPRTRP
jgi:hypothetical protein